jgi:hypothetical protein
MSAPLVEPVAKERSTGSMDEVDVWWGSYAGRAMTPSFAVCIVLTGLIYLIVRVWVPERGWQQFTFVAIAGAVWLVQLARWARRFFTWNYRLTTCYLYVDRGLRPLIAQRIALKNIERVEMQRNWLQKCLQIGDLWIWNNDKLFTVLQALKGPRAVMETIQEMAAKARENIK